MRSIKNTINKTIIVIKPFLPILPIEKNSFILIFPKVEATKSVFPFLKSFKFVSVNSAKWPFKLFAKPFLYELSIFSVNIIEKKVKNNA